MSANVDYRNLKPYRDYRLGRMLKARLNLLRIVVALGFVLFGEVFWYLQIVHGEYYAQRAEENRLQHRYERPPRGMLIDEANMVLVGNRPSFAIYMQRDRSRDARAEVAVLARYLGETPELLLEQLDKQKHAPAYLPVLLRPDVDIGIASKIEAHRPELPAIDVVMEAKRSYPLGEAAAHAIGYLSEASEAELKKRDDLMPGDRVGRSGVEQIYDADLRGRPGITLDEVDARGRSLGTVAVQRPPRAGRALRVTLDGQMQRDLYECFAGRSGGAIFLDPINGGVRALYSGPTYDPNVFAGRLRAADWTALINNPLKPLQNRPISSAYPPGSTFKVMMACAALEEGVIHPGETIFCGGSKNFYGRDYKCHKKGGHGSVGVADAVTRSCNVFFYTVGQELGIDRIAKWGHKFGFGEKSGIRLEGESPGIMPSSAWKMKTRGQPWYAGETISVSIGQGQMQATPLQMAVVASAIANGGYRVHPHFVDRPGDADQPEAIGLSTTTIALLKEAMNNVVDSDSGTARRARVPGVKVAGKTGTAQVVSRDTGAKDPGDNAWFMGFGPLDKPRLSWGIIVEHGGHGGETAAPIAGIVLRRYLERQQVIEKSDVPEPGLGIKPSETPLEPDEPEEPRAEPQVAHVQIRR
ncbi:MAG: penicillin-binding protein 2 [Acidobacteriota bacterium]